MIPLREGQSLVAGILHLHSSRPDPFSDEQLSRLEVLASGSFPAVCRAIAKQRMAEHGIGVDLIGASSSFLNLERQIRLTARHSAGTVLILGERGSGKELAASIVHGWSQRWEQAFIPVLVSALPEGLYAAELFGHERASFTGATAAREGRFRAAHGGALFLDEVADLPIEVQSALLRVIEKGELCRVGRDLPLQVDVRVVSATSLDLSELAQQGRFRRDLIDRLSVFEIRVPPLRERPEDIPLLANHFLTKHCAGMWRRPLFDGEGACSGCDRKSRLPCATPSFYEALQNYHWPGNVRELSHLILRLLATVPGEPLDVRHLPEHFRHASPKARTPPETLSLNLAVKDHIQRVLGMTGYNQSRAARLLDIPLSTLRSKMRKLQIRVPQQVS